MAEVWTADPENDGNFAPGDKIPLQRWWTFWFFKPRTVSEEDVLPLRWLDDFDTVQEFWACFNAIPSVLTLGPKHCLHLMKRNYNCPEWEDEANKAGGIWNLRVEKGMADEVWQTLCLAVIGEQFACSLPRHDEVCGVSVKPGPSTSNQMIFQLWHRDECHKGAIYDRLKTVLSKVTDMNNSFYRSIVEELRRAEKEARN